MRVQVLIDTKFMKEQLPGSVEAFIGKNDHDEQQYRRFLQTYNLQPEDVAIVKLNNQDWEHPFIAQHFG